jgi:hypothetical protein
MAYSSAPRKPRPAEHPPDALVQLVNILVGVKPDTVQVAMVIVSQAGNIDARLGERGPLNSFSSFVGLFHLAAMCLDQRIALRVPAAGRALIFMT